MKRKKKGGRKPKKETRSKSNCQKINVSRRKNAIEPKRK